MPHTIQVSDETFARMQALATPLVDTPDSIVARALIALEHSGQREGDATTSGVRMLNPAAPPSLTHSHLLSASLDGIILTKADTTWNNLMNAVIREAARRGMKPAELHKMLRVHTSIGVRVGTGFKYLQDAGLSVQGQDANSAWRQTYDLALLMGLSLEVEFAWPDTPKAAMPNVIGHFSVGGSIGAPPEKK